MSSSVTEAHLVLSCCLGSSYLRFCGSQFVALSVGFFAAKIDVDLALGYCHGQPSIHFTIERGLLLYCFCLCWILRVLVTLFAKRPLC
jgi:hypothetical protein